MRQLSVSFGPRAGIPGTLFVSHIKKRKPFTEQAAGDKLRARSRANPNVTHLTLQNASFTSVVNHAARPQPTSIAMGDFNGGGQDGETQPEGWASLAGFLLPQDFKDGSCDVAGFSRAAFRIGMRAIGAQVILGMV
jgi:hypothetical protein